MNMETVAKIAKRMSSCVRMSDSPWSQDVGAILIRANGNPVTVDNIVEELQCDPSDVSKPLQVMAACDFASEGEGGWRMDLEKILARESK